MSLFFTQFYGVVAASAFTALSPPMFAAESIGSAVVNSSTVMLMRPAQITSALSHASLVGTIERVQLTAGSVQVVDSSAASSGTTERVSVNSSGTEANASSYGPALSANGRFVVFYSAATNLVANDTNGKLDVFVHDRQTARTTRVSVSTAGVEGNGDSLDPVISADGRFIAFTSSATNLVSNDNNGKSDVFLYDCQTGETTLVSVNSDAIQANGASGADSISSDGEFITFSSNATNLAPNLSSDKYNVFVYDRRTGNTVLASVSSLFEGPPGANSANGNISGDGRFVAWVSDGSVVPPDRNFVTDIFLRDRLDRVTTRLTLNFSGDDTNDGSYNPSISADGRYVAFDSLASNLVPGDTYYSSDIFVYNLIRRQITRESVGLKGAHANGDCNQPSISADGRFVAFNSSASNLVRGDTNATTDVFVRDRQTGTTSRVSVGPAGVQANGPSFPEKISADGRVVAFGSSATNLVANDNNSQTDIFVHDVNLCSLDVNAVKSTNDVTVSIQGRSAIAGTLQVWSVSTDEINKRFSSSVSEANGLFSFEASFAANINGTIGILTVITSGQGIACSIWQTK